MSSLYKALVGLFSAGLLFGLGMWLGLTVISPPHGEHPGARVAAVPLGAGAPSDAATPRPVERAKPSEAMANPVADRKLSPVHPAEPGPLKPAIDNAERQTSADAAANTEPAKTGASDVTVGSFQPAAPQSVETTGSASAEPKRPQSNPAPAPSTAAAPAQDTRNSEPQIRAASLSSAENGNRCDVRACASAYKSFRESDCTYQPFSGPRQLCVSPPTAQRPANEASTYRARAQSPARAHSADLDGAVRAVERLTAGRRWSAEREPSGEFTRYDRAPRVYVLPDDDEDE